VSRIFFYFLRPASRLASCNSSSSPSPRQHVPHGPVKRWRSKMKIIIAALAVLSFVAGPVFAQTIIQTPHPGYYGGNTSPALTGGGSLGHNRLQQDVGN